MMPQPFDKKDIKYILRIVTIRYYILRNGDVWEEYYTKTRLKKGSCEGIITSLVRNAEFIKIKKNNVDKSDSFYKYAKRNKMLRKIYQ